MGILIKRPLNEMTNQDLEIYAYAMASVAQAAIHEAKFDIKAERAITYLDKAAESLNTAISILCYMHENEADLKRSENNGSRKFSDLESW